ncbi:hypothetical protein CMI47_06435 [Candidatus Pacearchaeota archaeon]|nr:hypothetical protein [Candidatus Pacearchaeota archaeon]|tara:strand:+ start:3901 stop:4824 length:924 start_codon:yes stop_codon:yes gene_type:complete
MSDFTYNKYDPRGSDFEPYVDTTDALANNYEQVISFRHVPTSHDVYFKAFITAYNETYSSDWASEAVYGRPDPIYLFKNTTRRVTLAFKVPAASEGEAYNNLGRTQQLLSFLYPRYSDVENAQTISQAPLIRLKVMNLLQKADESDTLVNWDQLTPSDMFELYTSSNSSDNGLLGVITNVNIDYHLGDDIGTLVTGPNTILPKLLEITVDFNAIHEHPLGWDEDDNFSAVFPYNVKTEGTLITYGSESEGSTDSAAASGDNEAAADEDAASLAPVLDERFVEGTSEWDYDKVFPEVPYGIDDSEYDQ